MAILTNIKTWDNEKKEEVSVTSDQKITEDTRLVWDPMPFKAFGRTTRISNIELSKIITSEFKQSMHDLYGSLVSMPIAPGQFRIDLYFEYNRDECPENKIRNLDSLVSPSKNSRVPEAYARTHALLNRRDGKTYTLTQETKILLAPFMFGGKDANRPNDDKRWNQFISEAHFPSQSPYYNNRAADRVILGVTGLDIRRVIRAIYGAQMTTHTVNRQVGDHIEVENFNSDAAMYDVRFGSWSKSRQGEFYLNIEQYDDNAVKEIYARENPMIQQGYGPICF